VCFRYPFLCTLTVCQQAQFNRLPAILNIKQEIVNRDRELDTRILPPSTEKINKDNYEKLSKNSLFLVILEDKAN
jgi:hypothetical protein